MRRGERGLRGVERDVVLDRDMDWICGRAGIWMDWWMDE